MSDNSDTEETSLNSTKKRRGRKIKAETLAEITEGSNKLQELIERKKAEKMAKTEIDLK